MESLFFSTETIGGADLCHTWGEDWGGGRETPGSDPLNMFAYPIFLDFYCFNASVLQHEGTVRPLLVFLVLLFVDEHAWFDKIQLISRKLNRL